MRCAIVVIFLTVAVSSYGQLDYGKPSAWNLPDQAREALEKQHTLKLYDISDSLNPFYLRGDFDGDGIPDYVVLVINRKTKKHGIAVVRSGAVRVDILGAGGTGLRVGTGEGSYLLEDFDWMDEWYVERKRKVSDDLGGEVAAKMRGEGFVAAKSESASALIYWNGRSWVWVQMGD